MNSGQKESISLAIEKYADMVSRICFLQLKNQADADDVFQDVFLRFISNYGKFENEEHEKRWLCKVTYNRCKDIEKSFWHKKTVGVDSVDIPYESDEQEFVIDSLKKLSPEAKQLLYLHYYEGMSVLDIAQTLGTNKNTIYTRLRRSRDTLKKFLSEELPLPPESDVKGKD